MRTLKNRLTLSHFLIALLIVFALSILFNLSLDGVFKQYALKQQKLLIQKINDQVNEQYNANSGLYNQEALEVIGNAALQNGILIHVQTLNKQIDWDIKLHKAKECQLALQHAENNMQSRYPNFKGNYSEDTYDLKYNGNTVGYLSVGYYGPYSLDDMELSLIDTLNNTLILLSAVFLILAIGIGGIMSKRISMPIVGVINAAKQIAAGDYIQTREQNHTSETAELVYAMNEMSRALKQNESQKKQITSDVAHELRTPLSNLQSHLETMIDDIWEPTKERLQSCHSEVLRLNDIVAQLQDLYVLENSKNPVQKERFDFYKLCMDLTEDFLVQLQEKEIDLVIRVPSPAFVFGDPRRIKQCMLNLLSNALHYVPHQGKVGISLEETELQTIISLSDTGPGILPSEIPFIFERFYRVDKSRSQATGGMGLGLAITKAITEAHGGSVLAQSVPGEGATFQLIFPKQI